MRVLLEECGCSEATIPNKVMRQGGGWLGGEVVAVNSPINPKGPNVREGETSRVRLPKGDKVGVDERLGSKALYLATHGLRCFSVAGGYAIGAERRRLPGS